MLSLISIVPVLATKPENKPNKAANNGLTKGKNDHLYLYEKDPEELTRWKQKDPIKVFEDKIVSQGISQSQIEEMKIRIKQEIDDAEKFAMESDWPSIEELHKNLYA